MINNFASLFERFKHIKNPKDERRRIAEVVSKELGLNIEEDKVLVKQNTLSIICDNYVKTEIFMKKEILLDSLDKAGLKHIKEIK